MAIQEPGYITHIAEWALPYTVDRRIGGNGLVLDYLGDPKPSDKCPDQSDAGKI
jgi:hypothetical protein